MLIFQLHLPHVTPNSVQALHALSHSEITFWKAPFPYQHVRLKFQLMPEQLSQMKTCYWYQMSDGRTSERWPICCLKSFGNCHSRPSSLGARCSSGWMSPKYSGIYSSLHVLIHRTIVLLVTGSWFPIHKRKRIVFPLPSFEALNSVVLCSYACSVVTGHTSGSSRNLG